ncbi:hypothetical protein H4R99_004229 [Coemansia sp. RSA 1722]|nr:hypothetical protein LPJ57_000643 [Coemansia sp. RSA 486]KAJ2236214.1 hypothetical protein IWW45_001969 [Coemansia sp. RSA 485]KAJ2598139.1 hypothetical protein H4R99_004229 [Coemansia sp. RSA 1722]KAJ2602712.1 hypothetical protein GGF39_000590 [Coemansia sp. RSA 1721]KAJ2640236.1 hypothetical protein GGF40_000135 [Coemansia sp. RSA 1286]
MPDNDHSSAKTSQSPPGKRQRRSTHVTSSSILLQEPIPASKPSKPSKIGGRNRPATLLLMFSPVSAPDTSEKPTADPETRSLGLLHYDTQTNEYEYPELHDCRVRSVFDGPESRGILYRAKRMQGKLDQALRSNRARYTEVYKMRMLKLEESGRYCPMDMEVIRGHLTTLQSTMECSSIGPGAQGWLTNGVASEDKSEAVVDRVEADKVLMAVAALRNRFALPVEFVQCAEFQGLACVLTTAAAQRSGRQLHHAVPKTADQYREAIARAHGSFRDRVCREIAQASDADTAGSNEPGHSTIALSLLIHGHKLAHHHHDDHQPDRVLLRLFASHQRRTFPIGWLLVDTHEPTDRLAEQVTQTVSALQDTVSRHSSKPTCVVSVVVAGLWRWSKTSELRAHVAQLLGCSWHMPSISHTVDHLAFNLLRRIDPSTPDILYECSQALVSVAQEIAGHPEAHSLWTMHNHQEINLPKPTDPWTSYFLLFQQMVSADYDLLLQLRSVVVIDDKHAGCFDCLLDRTRAPMFLALVQLLELLNHVRKTSIQPDCLLSDLAVVLARLEATLISLSSGMHDSATDHMQVAATHLLSCFRLYLGDRQTLLPMILAHALSPYPQCPSLSSVTPPLSSSGLLAFARDIWTQLTKPKHQLSMPELYTRWDMFVTELRRAASREIMDELPASFSVAKMFGFLGLSLDNNKACYPFSVVAAILGDCPGSLPADTELELPGGPDTWEQHKLFDPHQLLELEMLASENTINPESSTPASSTPVAMPNAVSIYEHQQQILNNTAAESANISQSPEPHTSSLEHPNTSNVSNMHLSNAEPPQAGELGGIDHATAAAAAAAAATILAASSDVDPADEPLSPDSPSLLLCYFDRNALQPLL